MGFMRGIDGGESSSSWTPLAGAPGPREVRRTIRSGELATGTLACPHCDAPVAPIGRMTPADPLACPFCAHRARVRDFLSLAQPSRPARVTVRVVLRGR